MEKLRAVEREGLKTDIPAFAPGDTVRVSVKVIEGEKERLQAFEGVVIRKRGGGAGMSFTVRRISYGVGVECTKAAAERARTVIALVNRRMPRSLGDSFIHVSRLTHVVEVDRPVLELPQAGEVGEVARAIGANVAELIEEGATLQMGIGAIPDAVIARLGERVDLGVHTEMFSDRLVDLAATGAITNRRKSVSPGRILTSFVAGTRKTFDFVDDNPLVEFQPCDLTNDPAHIRKNERVVAINSALQVDLSGQVCADSIGTFQFSGVGGQMDFIRGAALSRGGRAIIALPSTTTLRDGTLVTRIACMLKPGAGVVTSRNHVRYVVTEYGVADLYGKTIRQRATQLINIAHPVFREDLKKQAQELHYI